MSNIHTERLTLIPANMEILQAALSGNTQLAIILQAHIPEQWTEFGTAPLTYALDKIQENKSEGKWWTYFPVLKSENILVGSCGYKGEPDMHGTVEIGYEVAENFRNNGIATEIAKALIQHAFLDKRVVTVLAHTLAELNASCSVLQKCGFIKTADIEDPDDGWIWRWELHK